jgi:hypothetical protein
VGRPCERIKVGVCLCKRDDVFDGEGQELRKFSNGGDDARQENSGAQAIVDGCERIEL